jgi:hypothetical protein
MSSQHEKDNEPAPLYVIDTTTFSLPMDRKAIEDKLQTQYQVPPVLVPFLDFNPFVCIKYSLLQQLPSIVFAAQYRVNSKQIYFSIEETKLTQSDIKKLIFECFQTLSPAFSTSDFETYVSLGYKDTITMH